jgi:hypothetical protein
VRRQILQTFMVKAPVLQHLRAVVSDSIIVSGSSLNNRLPGKELRQSRVQPRCRWNGCAWFCYRYGA